MDKKDVTKELGAATLKGALGFVPGVGPIVAEIVGVFIPNWRMERLERLVRELSIVLGDNGSELFKRRAQDPAFIDLVEQAMRSATRALSEERIRYLANAIRSGLPEHDSVLTARKHLLSLLDELNDEEVVHLRAKAVPYRHDDEFRKRHESILNPMPAYIGAPPDVIDRETMQDAYLSHLETLGLLRPSFAPRPLRREESPEFDDRTGRLKSTGFEITRLGRMLLEVIGLAEKDNAKGAG